MFFWPKFSENCNFSTKDFEWWNESLPQTQFFNPYIFDTWWCTLCKPLIFHTLIIWSNRNHSKNYLRSTTLGCKDIRIRKSEFVAKTQFFYLDLTSFHTYIFSIQYCIIRQPPPRKYWVGPLYPSIYLSVYLWPDKSSIS